MSSAVRSEIEVLRERLSRLEHIFALMNTRKDGVIIFPGLFRTEIDYPYTSFEKDYKLDKVNILDEPILLRLDERNYDLPMIFSPPSSIPIHKYKLTNHGELLDKKLIDKRILSFFSTYIRESEQGRLATDNLIPLSKDSIYGDIYGSHPPKYYILKRKEYTDKLLESILSPELQLRHITHYYNFGGGYCTKQTIAYMTGEQIEEAIFNTKNEIKGSHKKKSKMKNKLNAMNKPKRNTQEDCCDKLESRIERLEINLSRIDGMVRELEPVKNVRPKNNITRRITPINLTLSNRANLNNFLHGPLVNSSRPNSPRGPSQTRRRPMPRHLYYGRPELPE